MSDHLQAFTSSKLVMARSMLDIMEREEGLSRESARQGYLFHLHGAVCGLLGEVLAASLLRVSKPVTLAEAAEILKHEHVASGGVQQIKNLAEHGWLANVLNDYEQAQVKVEAADKPLNMIVTSAIASDRASKSSRGFEGDYLNAMTELVQDIRGQLQEW